MPTRKLPSDKHLTKLYKAGKTTREIGDLFGATVATVAHHLRRLGIVRTSKESREMRFKPAFTKEWLYQKYVVEGLDTVQIGRLVNKDPKTIWYWMKKHQIPTRPRGTGYEKNLMNGRPTGWHHTAETIEKVRKATVESGRVPYMRNGTHYNKGKRGAVVWNWKGGVTPERQEFYRSDEWKKAVVAVWKRDDGICQRCKLDSRTVDRRLGKFHVHHVQTFAIKALRADPKNLTLLCDTCHRWVHSKQNINKEFLG